MSKSDYPPGYDPAHAPLYGPQGGGGYPPPPAYGFPGYGGPPQGHPSAPYGGGPNAPPYSGYPPGPQAGQSYPGAGYGYPNQPPMPPIPPMMPPTMPSGVFSSGSTHASVLFVCLFVCLCGAKGRGQDTTAAMGCFEDYTWVTVSCSHCVGRALCKAVRSVSVAHC